ncbi:MAG TPA: DNA circularization N-terminal domain-containing protein [Stellaceae bacterium]|nr:DNA circularization N-terminal domain-containing protein [Stellaceae bacterium]
MMLQASFRGAAFLFDAATTDFGRRVEVNEYPRRDAPFPEDVGKKARRFTLNAFVLGPDVDSARDALIAACETPGPGRLVHPRFGEIMVQCLDCQLNEKAKERGIARFSLTFTEVGPIAFAALADDTASAVSDAAAAAATAALASFTGTFSTADTAPYVTEAAQSDLGLALSSIIAAASTLIQDPFSAFAFLGLQADVILGDAATIAALVAMVSFLPLPPPAPAWSDQRARGLMDNDTVTAVRKAQLQLSAPPPMPTIVTLTPDRVQQAANQAALFTLVQQIALTEAAQAASASSFTSSNDAIAVRDEVAEAIDAVVFATSDDGVADSFTALRLALVADITTRAANLPAEQVITLKSSLPALLVAYRLYGDPNQGDDIVARNKIRNPLFVPAGVPMTVLAP